MKERRSSKGLLVPVAMARPDECLLLLESETYFTTPILWNTWGERVDDFP